jgi:tetrahydromethanopterin S-methyltransferase subunit G
MSIGEATAYEQVTRQMVAQVSDDLEEYKRRVNGSLEKIDQRLAAIEKQLNSRPSWPVSITITILSSLTVGLLTYLATTPR